MGCNRIEADSLTRLAFGHHRLGKLYAAHAAAAEATQIARQIQPIDQRLLSLTIYTEAWMLYELGQCDKALTMADEALTLMESLADEVHVARIQNLIGCIYQKTNRFVESADFLQHALNTFEQHELAIGIAVYNKNLGETALRQGDFEKAHSHFERANDIVQQLDHQDLRIIFADITGRIGAARKSCWWRRKAIALLTDVLNNAPQNWYLPDRARYLLAEAYLVQNQPALGLPHAQQAFRWSCGQGDPERLGHSWRVLGLLLAELSQSVTVVCAGEVLRVDSAECFTKSINCFHNANLLREEVLTPLAMGAM